MVRIPTQSYSFLMATLFVKSLKKITSGFANLDLIFTNREELIEDMTVIGSLDESDHVILELIISRGEAIEKSQTSEKQTDKLRGKVNQI